MRSVCWRLDTIVGILTTGKIEVDLTSSNVYGKAQPRSKRNLLPRTEPREAGGVPTEGEVGRLDGARFTGLAEKSRTPLLTRADNLLQLRIRLRTTCLHRQGHGRGAEV